jgi:hypothetical protein
MHSLHIDSRDNKSLTHKPIYWHYPKKALEGKPGGTRKRGKPHTRWIDNVEDDFRKVGIKRWRLRTADRREWRGMCDVATVLQEL